jgi:hypothetical protein
MMEKKLDNQVAAPAETRTPNLHGAKQNRSLRVRMEGWRHWQLGEQNNLSKKNTNEPT